MKVFLGAGTVPSVGTQGDIWRGWPSMPPPCCTHLEAVKLWNGLRNMNENVRGASRHIIKLAGQRNKTPN